VHYDENPIEIHTVSEERINDLEARFAWLERHSAERDVEMNALHDRIRRLERQVERIAGKLERPPEAQLPPPQDEKPPHY
jgi:uncharacterized coiled-coil protein SlyX